MRKFVGIKRVHRAIININNWRKLVDSQNATHLWGFLSSKRNGVNADNFTQFGEQNDKKFFDDYMRVQDTNYPYYDPVVGEFRIDTHYHSNVATARKNTFKERWEAALSYVEDGKEMWQFMPTYLEIIKKKILSKNNVYTKVPLFDVLAWLYRAYEFPDDITLISLITQFKEDFHLLENEFETIFTDTSFDGSIDKPENFFVNHKIKQDLLMKVIEDKEDFDLTETLAIMDANNHEPVSIEQILELLTKGRKQLVLQGPPGTGKTFIARQIAAKLLGCSDANIQDPTELSNFLKERQFSMVPSNELNVIEENNGVWDIIQFHPSYTYEDFIRGITAKLQNGGTPTFEVENRIFGQLAELSTKTEKPIILIVDEINRGDLSKVMGELVYALEYRNESVRTPYVLKNSSVITVGKNFYLLATMNTSDRSIALIDYAIRRRFTFVELLPERVTLETYLNNNTDLSHHSAKILDLFDAVAKLFEDQRDFAIGHTYFMGSNIEEIANTVVFQVLPLLSEYQKEGILDEHANIPLDGWPGESALRTNHPRPFQLAEELHDWLNG